MYASLHSTLPWSLQNLLQSQVSGRTSWRTESSLWSYFICCLRLARKFKGWLELVERTNVCGCEGNSSHVCTLYVLLTSSTQKYDTSWVLLFSSSLLNAPPLHFFFFDLTHHNILNKTYFWDVNFTRLPLTKILIRKRKKNLLTHSEWIEESNQLINALNRLSFSSKDT